MQHSFQTKDIFFEVQTPLDFRVRVTVAYWQLITTTKHPVMAGRHEDVKNTILNPSQIRLSRTDATVYLFYSHETNGRWICAVVKRLNGDGFLITTYPTDAIKEGEQIWMK